MSPGSSTESYPAFACIEFRESPGKNFNQVNEIRPRKNQYFRVCAHLTIQVLQNSHDSDDHDSEKYCNEIETLAHVLGSCQHGELLRNSRHHNIRKLIAQALRNKSFEVHEEVHCVASEGGGIRRADIVALDKTNSKGFILDPTVRFEMSQTQPSEVNKEKQQIYEPTIPYFREKYQMEGTWEVHGLMIGARGTIPRSTVNTIKTFGIHDIIPKIITSTIKGSVAILKNHLYGIS
ncbi:hypothetical protein ANN_12465 [Periplaneta americana]|uniref:Uncharacterized protein n=1 Tax=Periplaneta americana TaxID=6978 RepID=A0ABQ8TGU3_PERAM|nr:hypothetical protein ANN_12465 [Periplaneta americana]